MAITITNGGSTMVEWSDETLAPNTTAQSFAFSISALTGSYASSRILSVRRHSSGYLTWQIYVLTDAGTNYLYFAVTFSTQVGIWRCPITLAQNNDVVITLDGSSTSNNAVMYINGSSATVTREQAPIGTIDTSSAGQVRLGYNGSISAGTTLRSFNKYNKVLSSVGVLDLYNSRRAFVFNSLVFCADLRGAAGGTDDGDTLGSTNYISDLISGGKATPSGSPVFAADNYLNWRIT